MPGLEELLAMAGGGGGGGGPMPPQGGAPPGGGGMGGALSQVLGNLMQDPVAMKGMQEYMMQMGGGMGAPGAAQAPPPQGPMDMTGGIPPGAAPPPGAPMDAEAMATDAIDGAGATWDGVDAPTQNDIERLLSDPSPTNVDSFNQQFGEGAAEKYLGEEGGESVPEEAEPVDDE